jgi:hypothetical protein
MFLISVSTHVRKCHHTVSLWGLRVRLPCIHISIKCMLPLTFTGCYLVIQYACSNVAISGTVTGRYMENVTQRSHMLCIRQPTNTPANRSPLPRTLRNAASTTAASTHTYDLEFFFGEQTQASHMVKDAGPTGEPHTFQLSIIFSIKNCKTTHWYCLDGFCHVECWHLIMSQCSHLFCHAHSVVQHTVNC